jgi:hypothetical protein
LHAISSQAAKKGLDRFDYYSRFEFTVPENGEMPAVEFDAKKR